jgi:hypothetical protein
MKTDRRIERLYENLTAEEKAALVFASLGRLDKAEADRIESTVALKVYRVQDLAYSERYDRLVKLAFWWGLTWWHEFAKYSASLGLIGIVSGSGNDELADEVRETLVQGRARLAALQNELDVVCGANGVDPGAVRKIAEVGEQSLPYAELPPGGAMAPDVEFVEEIRGMLSKLAR